MSSQVGRVVIARTGGATTRGERIMSRLNHDAPDAMEAVMIRRRRLVHAVLAALAAPGAGQAALDETVVTATKRE